MISLMNPNREEVLFALALEKPAEKRAPLFQGAICAGCPPCASAKQLIDPLEERDDQRCLSLARV